MTPSPRIRVNGKDRPHAPAALTELLAGEGIDLAAPRGVAVALNGTVVPRRAWGETALTDGDTVEIVRIMQGG